MSAEPDRSVSPLLPGTASAVKDVHLFPEEVRHLPHPTGRNGQAEHSRPAGIGGRLAWPQQKPIGSLVFLLWSASAAQQPYLTPH